MKFIKPAGVTTDSFTEASLHWSRPGYSAVSSLSSRPVNSSSEKSKSEDSTSICWSLRLGVEGLSALH